MTKAIKAPYLIDDRTKLRRRHPGRYWYFAAFDDKGETRISAKNMGDFDTLIIEDWFSIECIDVRTWGIMIGDRRFEVHIPSNSRKEVEVEEK